MVMVCEEISGTMDIYNRVNSAKEIALWISNDGEILGNHTWYNDVNGKIVYDRKASLSEICETLEAAKDELLSRRAEISEEIEILEADAVDVVEIDD